MLLLAGAVVITMVSASGKSLQRGFVGCRVWFRAVSGLYSTPDAYLYPPAASAFQLFCRGCFRRQTIQKTHRTHLSGAGNDTFTVSTIATAASTPYVVSENGLVYRFIVFDVS